MTIGRRREWDGIDKVDRGENEKTEEMGCMKREERTRGELEGA